MTVSRGIIVIYLEFRVVLSGGLILFPYLFPQ